jgi:hypothetical protein
MTTKLDLLKDALACAPENYKDNVRIITGLDDKAQKMGTIAGVFLGVLLALVKPDQLSTLVGLIGQTGIWVVTFVILLLIVCVGLSLWCMWTKVIPPPLSMKHLTYISDNIDPSQLPAEEDYCNERIAVWRKCIEAQSNVATSKQKRVLWAQVTLAVAMAVIAGMLLYLIHSTHADAVPTTSSFEGYC